MSKYFTEAEEVCKCCGKLPENGMSDILLSKLDQLREKAGEPIFVSCMYRCPKHNADPKVGGEPNSQHLYGTAADIYCDNLSVDELADLAIEVGFDGIGRYYGDEFVHVDCRDGGESPNGYAWER